MPILRSDDPAILNADPTAEVDTMLPSLQELQANVDALASVLGQQQYKLDSSTLWQVGGQKGIAGVLTNVGTPQGPIFNQMLSASALPPESLDMIRAFEQMFHKAIVDVTKEVMESLLDTGIGVASTVASMVPVVGIVAKALISLGEIIYKGVQAAKAYGEPLEVLYERQIFDPAFDKYALNLAVLKRSRTTNDWTPIFNPPGALKSSQTPWGGPIAAYPLVGGGYAIKSAAMTEASEEGWLGFMPGATDVSEQGGRTQKTLVHRIWEAGTAGGVLDTGMYLPSAGTTAQTIWGMVTRQNPAMMCVDAELAMTWWAIYLKDLRDFLEENTLFGDSAKRNMIDQGVKIFGWAPYGAQKGSADLDPWEHYGISNSYPVRNLRALHENQFRAMNTTLVAYVDGSYAALSDKSSAIYQRWEANRPKLLKHPARCSVDLSNVPSTSTPYRLALEGSGVGQPLCGVGEAFPLAVEGPADPVPYPIDPGLFHPFPRPPEPQAGGFPWGKAALGGLAILGGVYAARKLL